MGAEVADPATEGGCGLRGVSALLRLDKKGSRVMGKRDSRLGLLLQIA